MEKPTVFFSHSSKDEAPLVRLKNRLIEMTGNAIDIFMSSDGQSIPLGRNWVHTIELALLRSKLMFVFLSPTSIQSKWVYFESGFAYAKGIRVVPVGVLGTDLSQLRPPLSLLQGFNVRSSAGLNNVIAVMNREFAFQFREEFTDQDYAELFTPLDETAELGFGSFSHRIRVITIAVHCLDVDPHAQIAAQLEAGGIEHQVNANVIHVAGASFGIGKERDQKREVRIALDAGLARLTVPIAVSLIKGLRRDAQAIQVSVVFEDGVAEVRETQRLTSRLYGTGVKFGTVPWLTYRTLRFQLTHHTRRTRDGEYRRGATVLHLECDQPDDIDVGVVHQLVDMLFARDILLIEPWA